MSVEGVMNKPDGEALADLEMLALRHLESVVGVASGPGMDLAIQLSRAVLDYVGSRREPQELPPAGSLGDQPHDPANCFTHRGRPHPGPCMDAEAFTRWYWTEGPGSEPLAAEQIALATQRLVAEAYAAREQRQRWGQPS